MIKSCGIGAKGLPSCTNCACGVDGLFAARVPYGPLVAALVTGGNEEVAFPSSSGILIIGSFVGWKQSIGVENGHTGHVDITVMKK